MSSHLKIGDLVSVKPGAFVRFDGFRLDQRWTGKIVQIDPPCVLLRGETLDQIPSRWCLSCSPVDWERKHQVATPVAGTVTLVMDEDSLIKV